MTLVTNYAPRLVTIALGGRAGSAIRLAPGVNKVDSDAWEVAKRNTWVQSALAGGKDREGLSAVEPTTVVGVPANAPGAAGVALSGLSAIQANDMVAATFNRKMLAEYRAVEKRGTVIAAIDLQLAELDARDKADAELAASKSNAKAKNSD